MTLMSNQYRKALLSPLGGGAYLIFGLRKGSLTEIRVCVCGGGGAFYNHKINKNSIFSKNYSRSLAKRDITQNYN